MSSCTCPCSAGLIVTHVATGWCVRLRMAIGGYFGEPLTSHWSCTSPWAGTIVLPALSATPSLALMSALCATSATVIAGFAGGYQLTYP